MHCRITLYWPNHTKPKLVPHCWEGEGWGDVADMQFQLDLRRNYQKFHLFQTSDFFEYLEYFVKFSSSHSRSILQFGELENLTNHNKILIFWHQPNNLSKTQFFYPIFKFWSYSINICIIMVQGNDFDNSMGIGTNQITMILTKTWIFISLT